MVSPARNEEKFLPRVIKSVNKSSVRPALWVIVDDNSNDRTPNILQDASKEQRYIKTLRLNSMRPRSSFNYSYVCKIGFVYAIQLSREKEIDWEYIFLLDADTIVERTYFYEIINKMKKDHKIGIASGDIYILKKGKIKNIKYSRNDPFGTARIWRRDCFYETNGYSINQATDSISTIKANLKGWKTIRFREPKAYQLRETFSAKGLWKGYISIGEAIYHLRYHPLFVLTIGLSYIINPKFYLIIPYFMGYLVSMIRKEPRIQDEEIVEYYNKWKLDELLKKLRVQFARKFLDEKDEMKNCS